jgi:hypothetical protein
MNITEFKYRYDFNAKDALVLYRYILCQTAKVLYLD